MARMEVHSGDMICGVNVDVYEGMVPQDTIFLHGNLSSNTWWQPSLALWKKAARPDYKGRLIFAEWRGCGKSEHPKTEAELEMPLLGADCVEILRKLDVRKANLVAHSTGGTIALYAMLQAQGLFDRAVFLDAVGAKGVQFGPEMYAAFTQMSESREVCEAVMNGTIQGNDIKSPLFQQIVDDTFGVAKVIWHGIPNALAKVNLEKELSKIQVPVLVLHGEVDGVLPQQDSVDLARGLGRGEFRLLKGQGHSTNVENPKLFVETVNQFLFP